MAAALLPSSGVALAFKEIQCETDIKCVGTRKVARMADTDGFNAMYVLDRGDLLYGYGDDELSGGRGVDVLNGGTGDETLKGGRSGETYHFDISWGHDTIIDKAKAATPSTPFREINKLEFHFERDAPVSNLAINLESDSGPVPEMTDGVNTVNWDGDIIAMVDNNNPGSDTITGDGQANHIYNQDGSGSDTINGGGGNDELVYDNDGNVSDNVDGGTGDDYVSSTGFSDNETTHPDKVFGGEGNNYIVVQEGVGGDTVECGPGTDTVLFDDGDVISPNCERRNPRR
jgi:Ca2+-binding RTX toxin-like protein